MDNKEYYRGVFAKNLCRVMELRGKNQADIIRDLNLNRSAVSTWCNGTRIPRMDKIDQLATYLNVQPSDLIEDPHKDSGKPTPLNKEEEKLISLFRSLNSSGQMRLIESAEDFAQISKYTCQDAR